MPANGFSGYMQQSWIQAAAALKLLEAHAHNASCKIMNVHELRISSAVHTSRILLPQDPNSPTKLSMDAPYSFSMQQYQQQPLMVMHAGASAGALNSHRLSPSASESGLSSKSSGAGLKAMHNNSTAQQSLASASNTGAHSTAASHTATASFSAWKLTAAPGPSGEAGQGQGVQHGGCCAERSWSRSSGGEEALKCHLYLVSGFWLHG